MHKLARNRYLATGVAVAGAVVSMVVPLAYYPPMLARLGKETTGVWFSLLSLMFFLGIFDLGLSSVHARLAPAALAFFRTRQLFDTSARERLLLPIDVLLGVFRRVFPLLGLATFVLAMPIGIGYLASIEQLSRSAVICWCCLAASVWISLGTSYYHAILTATLDLFYLSLPRLVNGCVIVVGYGLVLTFMPSIEALGAVYLVGCVAASSVTVLRAIYIRRVENVPEGKFMRSGIPPLLRQSLRIMLTGCGSLMLLQGSVLIASWTLGPGAVADYHALQRLIVVPLSLCVLFYGATQPVLSAAFGSGDLARFRSIALQSTRLVTLSVASGVAGIAILSPAIVADWSADFRFAGATTAALFALTAVVTAQEQGSTTAALCLNRVPFVRSTLAAGVINFVLGFLLARRFGTAGLAGATALALVITNGWYSPFYVLRHASISLDELRRDYLRPLGAGILALVGGATVLVAAADDLAWEAGLSGWAIFCAAIVFCFGFTAEQRTTCVRLLRGVSTMLTRRASGAGG